MKNTADEIIELLNYIKPPDAQIHRDMVFTSHKNHMMDFKPGGTDYLKKMSSGYVSYFRGAHPSSFPLEIPISNYNRTIDADYFGDALANDLPDFKELKLVTVEMSNLHFYNYFQHNMLLERNSIGSTRSRDSHGDQLKIQATTAMYPLESSEDERIGTYNIEDVLIKTKIKGKLEKFKYRTNERFFDISLANEKYLHDNSKSAEISSNNTSNYKFNTGIDRK